MQLLRKLFAGGLLLLGGGCLLVGLLMLWAPGVLTRGLEVEDSLAPADALVVVDGDYPFRSLGALDLYQDGLAPLIVLPTQAICEGVMLMHAKKSKYGPMWARDVRCYLHPFPESAIQVWGNTTSHTAEELKALTAYLESRGYSRVIMVTSDYHARRVRMLLNGLPHNFEVSVVASPHGGILEQHRWRNHPHTIRLVLAEYGKIILQGTLIKLGFY